MSYLIDSDHVIDYLKGEPNPVELIGRIRKDGLWVSIITDMEVYQGVRRDAAAVSLHSGFQRFLAFAPILPFSPAVARRCADLRETLQQQGRRVRSRHLDLITAATALEYGLTLVTRNTQDYADVPGLTLLAPS